MTGESSSTTTNATANAAQRQAVTAYLGPLCQKHDKGELITYEDLMASKQAADSILAKDEESSATTMKVIQELHASQLTAYKTAAKAALQSWVSTWTLPPPAADDTWADFRQKWVSAACAAAPDWKLIDKEGLVKNAKQGKALSFFNAKRRELKQQQAAAASAEANKNSDDAADGTVSSDNSNNNKPSDEAEKMEDIEEGEEEEEEAGGDDEEGEVEEEEEEDGEMEEGEEEQEEEEDGEMAEDGEEGEETVTSNNKPRQQTTQKQEAPSSGRKTRKGKNAKGAAGGAAKQVPRKKNLPNKPLGQSKTVRGTRKSSRRGGRAAGGNK